jgi:hypothetical protein
MTGSTAPNKYSNPAHQLIGLAVLLVVMYLCMRTLRFTNDWLNLGFFGLFLLVPLLAIAIVILRLPGRAKVWTSVFLSPFVAISLLGLLSLVTFDIPAVVAHRQLSRELSTVQQARYSVHLAWQETAGGALGPHGVLLEQRRTIVPGLYAVKTLGYFEGASEGRISAVGPDRIELHIPNGLMHREVDRVYSLKPWLYF